MRQIFVKNNTFFIKSHQHFQIYILILNVFQIFRRIAVIIYLFVIFAFFHQKYQYFKIYSKILKHFVTTQETINRKILSYFARHLQHKLLKLPLIYPKLLNKLQNMQKL